MNYLAHLYLAGDDSDALIGSLMGLGLYFSVDWLEHRLCPWMYVR